MKKYIYIYILYIFQTSYWNWGGMTRTIQNSQSPVLIGHPWCWGWGGPSGRCTLPLDLSSSPCRWKVDTLESTQFVDAEIGAADLPFILIVWHRIGGRHQIIATVGFIPHCFHTHLESQRADICLKNILQLTFHRYECFLLLYFHNKHRFNLYIETLKG